MISSTDYKILADHISLAEDQKSDIVNDFYLLYTKLYTVETNVLINFSKVFGDQVYSQYINYIPTTNTTKSMVAALQNHIFNNYGDVNTFLQNNTLKVFQSFATLSAEVGYTILPGNIE